MALEGPTVALLAIELLALFAAVVALGEVVRSISSRVAPILRTLGAIERVVLDLYLGGALLYALAALPFGLFSPLAVAALLALGVLALGVGLARRSHRLPRGPRPLVAHLRRRGPELVALGSALVLFLVEMAAVVGVGSGNTFDSSVLATYTGLLGLHHSLPLTFAPVATGWIAYPQGTTVWLGTVDAILATPPVATALLVTPLFLAAFPLAAYAFGLRLTGSRVSAAVLALFTALAAPWTREMAFGSNDFALAAPLVLILASWCPAWGGERGPALGDALAFGALAGYAAALNPVGPEWLFVVAAAFLALGVSSKRSMASRLRAYGTALAAALPWVTPSLYALAQEHTAAPAALASGGIGPNDLVGLVDPFLYGPGHPLLSPFPVLQVELSALLVVGAFLLLHPEVRARVGDGLARLLLVGGLALAALLALGLLARGGVPGFPTLESLTSPGEESLLLFELYAILAATPLLWLAALSRGGAATAPTVGGAAPARHTSLPRRSAVVAGVVAALLLLPGAAVTGALLPGQLHASYVSFGNVTSSDEALLAWCADHLPSGAAVLVAPGSAAEFLPGYAPTLRVLEPMNGAAGPATATDYQLVVDQLIQGALNATGLKALHALGAEYVAVTQANSVLFEPFLAPPLERAGWPVLFAEGDAWLFAVPP